MNQSQTDQILTCIVDGMRSDRPDAIRGAAANALINSLEFTRSNFESQGERHHIMQVFLGRAGCSMVTVRCFCLGRVLANLQMVHLLTPQPWIPLEKHFTTEVSTGVVHNGSAQWWE